METGTDVMETGTVVMETFNTRQTEEAWTLTDVSNMPKVSTDPSVVSLIF